MSARGLLVTADDRSGALEAAALCADAGWTCVVTSWDGDRADTSRADSSVGDAEVEVVDLRSRHVAAPVAARRAASTIGLPAVRRVHKMDSTLRGNWAAELTALASGRRLLVIPAYPSAGRTCEHGLVLVNGVPVAESEFGADLRSATHSSRPAEALGAVEIGDVAELIAWLGRSDAPVAVADAKTDQEVVLLVRRAAAVAGLLLAGPALVTGVLARLSAPRAERVTPPRLPVGDVVLVRGSRHPVSRAQAKAAAGLPGVVVVEPDAEAGSDPEVVALELAVRAHDVVAATAASIVVLLGGDTADAFIGERSVRILGSLDTGVACGEMEVDGRTLTIVAKPGGFGHDLTVRDLLSRRRPS